MTNTLASVDDLSGFSGAPFTEAAVDAAAAELRAAARWHIAPEVTETLTVDARGGYHLILPTLNLTSVTAARDVTDPDNPVVLDEFRFSRAGVLYRAGGWPSGFQTVEVDVVHGYADTPADLYPVLADIARAHRAGGRVAQESLGSRSVSFERGSAVGASPALSRYTIPTLA